MEYANSDYTPAAIDPGTGAETKTETGTVTETKENLNLSGSIQNRNPTDDPSLHTTPQTMDGSNDSTNVQPPTQLPPTSIDPNVTQTTSTPTQVSVSTSDSAPPSTSTTVAAADSMPPIPANTQMELEILIGYSTSPLHNPEAFPALLEKGEIPPSSSIVLLDQSLNLPLNPNAISIMAGRSAASPYTYPYPYSHPHSTPTAAAVAAHPASLSPSSALNGTGIVSLLSSSQSYPPGSGTPSPAMMQAAFLQAQQMQAMQAMLAQQQKQIRQHHEAAAARSVAFAQQAQYAQAAAIARAKAAEQQQSMDSSAQVSEPSPPPTHLIVPLSSVARIYYGEYLKQMKDAAAEVANNILNIQVDRFAGFTVMSGDQLWDLSIPTHSDSEEEEEDSTQNKADQQIVEKMRTNETSKVHTVTVDSVSRDSKENLFLLNPKSPSPDSEPSQSELTTRIKGETNNTNQSNFRRSLIDFLDEAYIDPIAPPPDPAEEVEFSVTANLPTQSDLHSNPYGVHSTPSHHRKRSRYDSDSDGWSDGFGFGRVGSGSDKSDDVSYGHLGGGANEDEDSDYNQRQNYTRNRTRRNRKARSSYGVSRGAKPHQVRGGAGAAGPYAFAPALHPYQQAANPYITTQQGGSGIMGGTAPAAYYSNQPSIYSVEGQSGASAPTGVSQSYPYGYPSSAMSPSGYALPSQPPPRRRGRPPGRGRGGANIGPSTSSSYSYSRPRSSSSYSRSYRSRHSEDSFDEDEWQDDWSSSGDEGGNTIAGKSKRKRTKKRRYDD